MLCIGYGRHPPQNIPETCVTISSMMTGATFYALFIAYSINVIQTMDSPGRSYREKVRSVCSLVLRVLMYSRSEQVPFQVSGLICNVLRHVYSRHYHSMSPTYEDLLVCLQPVIFFSCVQRPFFVPFSFRLNSLSS